MIYILLTAGCVEDTKTVEVRNSVPTISIESHVDGDTVFVGDAITFRALVTDNNNGPSELEVQWEAGDRVACPYTPPDGGGLSTCVTTLELGEEEVKATVRDPKNASATAGVQLVLYYSDPPSAQILAPLSDGIYYADELILLKVLRKMMKMIRRNLISVGNLPFPVVWIWTQHQTPTVLSRTTLI